MDDTTDSGRLEGVAVVGMVGRFPGARSVGEFWESLRAGREGVSFFTDDELLAAGVPADQVHDPAYVKARGLIDHPEWFDAAFFGVTPREAELMDPQHRLFLEACWQALENAGYAPTQSDLSVGVWGGMSTGMTHNTYLLRNLHARPGALGHDDTLAAMLGNENDYLTTRVSYKLDLRGPSVNVQTACSTSLVAIAQAFQSLMTYGCDMALAGGVSVSFPQREGYLYQEGDIGSPDGHCRPFDRDAAGTVFSNGVGVVVLKRLEDALADRDTIYAVVRGAAMNNDGAAKMSFAAPSVEGQADVIALAQAVAGVDPDSITYVETHGTGTPIGDPIEVAGLTRAFRRGTEAVGFCGIGSVKSNVGHLDSAAGVAAFIKTVLCLHHRTLVPTVHFREPNPRAGLEGSPFYVCAETRDWEAPGGPLRAGVSGFGIGGTNAHVVLEEAPEPAAELGPEGPHLLVLSAKTRPALEQAAAELAEFLGAEPAAYLGDVAFTLREGREAFRHRLCLSADDAGDAAAALASLDRSRLAFAQASASDASVAFLFPGGGAQYLGMGRELYEREPTFREAVDEGLALFRARTDVDLAALWFGSRERTSAEREAAEREFERPSLQLPAIFILEMALARLWRTWGIEPSALLGHSVGENTAACLAGVLSYADALELVSLRGRLFETVPSGGMLSVPLPLDELRPYLDERLDVAAINAPAQCTVSGDVEALTELRRRLEADDVEAQIVPIDIAAHSRLIDPILKSFGDYLRSIELSPPQIPFVSNTSGTWITDDEATDPEYWVRHLRSTVRFADGVSTLLQDPECVFLEVGPGRILGSLVRLQAPAAADRVVPSMRHPREDLHDVAVFRMALGRLWAAGVSIDWAPLSEGPQGRRVALPTYPFQRKRFLVEPGEPRPDASAEVDVPVVADELDDRPRREIILDRLRAILHELSGLEPDGIDAHLSFIDMGFDSLFLTQANLRFKREFKVRITFRQLFDDAPCLDALASYIDEHLPADASVGPRSTASASSPEGVASEGTASAEASAAQVGPYKPMRREMKAEMGEAQQAYLAEFLEAYEARTRGSKDFTREHRAHFADPRAVAGFKSAWKEITYPIVAERSKGARIWDVDGNEYVDCVGGFGATFFGHAPDFVMEAVRRQTDMTVDYGPQSTLAPETARLVCEMTGMDRASFCNTGSEAVLAAMRIARTVTGNDLIATFAGDYHGIFDEVLVKTRTIGGERRNVPAAPGIPATSSHNLLVLDYGDPESLRILAERADELAGVLIEPIQSRRPELQPREFLHEVRRITREAEIPMIFDEIITGFRLHPRGAQAWFDVDVDLACYGKAVGGGMPVGIVAGRAEYMDALDGGPWEYGDDSFPEAGVTYFAGTFIRHPLAVSAVRAVLEKLQAEGPELQQEMNRKTALFAESLNREYRRLGVPVELTYFGSVFLPRFRGDADLEGLFYHHLRHLGVHIWEGRPGFLTTEHDEVAMLTLMEGFLEAGRRMLAAGFFPGAAEAEQTHDWTEAQSELWLACALGDDASAAYNEQVVLELRSPVDVEVLDLALDKAVNRHASLRSRVRPDNGGFAVARSVSPVLDLRDVTQELDGTREPLAQELLREHIDRPFDLQQGPLVRARLVSTAEDRHLFCLCVSHLVCDGWSLEVVLQDLAHFYTSIRQGRQVERGTPPLLEELSAVQAGRVHSGELADARAFWMDVFSEAPAPLDLPLDRPRPKMKTYRGERTWLRNDSEVVARLRTLAREQGCTLFVVLLAAYEALLHQLSGQRDLVVGVPAAGHPASGLLDLVTHDVNLLPFRADLDASLPFTEFLHELRDRFNDAKSYQDFAFGALLKELRLPRDPSRLPLIATSFNVDLEFEPLLFEEERARFVTTPRSYVKYDLLFNHVDEGDGLTLEVDHNADLLDEATVAGWIVHYEALLREIVTDPTRSVTDLHAAAREGSDEGEDGSLGVATLDFPQEGGLHDRFAARVAETPDQVALVHEDRSWTYRELAHASNRVAHALIAAGVEPGAQVGVCAARSCELVAGLIGVLEAGAAYVPLDPEYPRERLEMMIADARPAAVLVLQGSLASLPALDVPVVELGSVIAGDGPSSSPAVETTPDDLAYVIYTSGSTGRPKGVAVTHGNVLRLLDATDHWFGFGDSDVWTLFHSYAFDFSVWEMWGALLNGGRLVVVPSLVSRDPVEFRALLAREGVTVLNQTPSAFGGLVDLEGQHEDRLPLRLVIFGGEALAYGGLLPWIEKYGDDAPRLVNMYGITETTVHVTYRPVSDVDVRESRPSYIGVPIPDLQLYVLDPAGRPVMLGTEGELHVGGAGLARGYLNRPDLTAERFIDNPFGDGRLYRSGDLVRLTREGELEYRGRIDDQVQLRGFRIELGEIVAAMTLAPSVAQCVAILREDRAGDPRLVAYVTPASGASADTVDVAALRDLAARRLPAYMVPQHVVVLDRLPLTPNGKVDRGALPVPEATASGDGRPPETELERIVADVWREVLGVETVALNDDFFESGGHSLLATQLLARVEHELGVRVPLRALFEQPTLGSLVSRVEGSLMEDVEGMTDEEVRAAMTPTGSGSDVGSR